jgi:hypothetical protein
VALCGGLLAACLVSGWPQFKQRSRKPLLVGISLLLLSNFAFTYVIAKGPKPESDHAKLLQSLESSALAPMTTEQMREVEYREDSAYLTLLANQIAYRPRGADLLLYPAAKEYGGLSFADGHGQILAQDLGNEHREFHLRNDEAGRVRLNTYYYPHWIARLDGHEIKIEMEASSGLMLVEIPAGEHTLTFNYEVRQRAEVWARRISALAWLSLVGWLLRMLYYKINQLGFAETPHASQ